MTQPSSDTPIYLHLGSACCAQGDSISDIEQRLFDHQKQNPLSPSKHYSNQELPLGQLSQSLNQHLDSLTIERLEANSRNNRLLKYLLDGMAEPLNKLFQSTAKERIGCVIGTSTTGISDGEQAVAHWQQQGQLPERFHYSQQEIGSASDFVSRELNISGPCYSVSTACTSGAKALSSAARMIRADLADAVIAGGCDSLCKLTVEGFSALGAVSNEPCQPFSQTRAGINIGEGGCLFIVSKEPSEFLLSGVGESSDAHHISAPEPNGAGAEAAMHKALQRANCEARDIDYINLHGTATAHNDSMEAKAVARVFGNAIAASSTKVLTGHTLGAAGALEALFCCLSLKRDDAKLPRLHYLWQQDSELPELTKLNSSQLDKPMTRALSNSFAFGGNNIALLIEKTEYTDV